MSVLLNLYSEMNLQPLGNRIGGVMVSVLIANVVNCMFEPRQAKPMTIQLIFAATSLSKQL
jgi:hypothetical protein